MREELDGIPQITPDELLRIVESDDEKKPTLIDVREEHEYASGHIPGIRLIPMSQFPDHIDSLDPEEEYILVCRSGSRSQKTAKYLKLQGFKKVNNYIGGMLHWPGAIETNEKD
jgi:rhodanese-related sulfurtransferase